MLRTACSVEIKKRRKYVGLARVFVFVAVRRQEDGRIEVCVCICVCVEEQASDRYRDSYARDPSGNLGKTAEKNSSSLRRGGASHRRLSRAHIVSRGN